MLAEADLDLNIWKVEVGVEAMIIKRKNPSGRRELMNLEDIEIVLTQGIEVLRKIKRRKRKTPTFNQLISPTLFSGRKDGLLKRKYKKATEMPSTEIRVITYFILFVL